MKTIALLLAIPAALLAAAGPLEIRFDTPPAAARSSGAASFPSSNWESQAQPVGNGLGLDSRHQVPLDKKLSAAWLASLTARGKPSSWTDWAALQHIGMPVAGIGTGTVYLGGDGRLWGWDLFNVPHDGAVPGTVPGIDARNGANYLKPSKMESPWNVSHGLVLHVDGQTKRLDHTGFPQVEFTGQYPIGQIKLNDPASAISVVMETYSPFIPLDYDNSSLPVTVIEITLKNAGESALKVDLEAYLENAAIRYQPTTSRGGLRRVARVLPLGGGAMVMGEVKAPASADSPRSCSPRTASSASPPPAARPTGSRSTESFRSPVRANGYLRGLPPKANY